MTYDKEGRRYGHMITNLSECVNKVLKDYHNIPITALVKSTYNRCRKYFVDRGRQAPRQLKILGQETLVWQSWSRKNGVVNYMLSSSLREASRFYFQIPCIFYFVIS